MEKKQANVVTPTGDFINNLVLEFAKRMVRNQERISSLLKEAGERFGSELTKQQTYAILTELTKLGFDIEPNEWLFFTPIENRAEVLNKYLVRTGKSYGSRNEDIRDCIKCKEEKLKEIAAWMSENKDAEKLNPQTFYRYEDLKSALQARIKELEGISKMIKEGAYVYVRGNHKPFTLIGVNEDGKMYGILRSASGDMFKAAYDEMSALSDQHALTDMEEKDNETGLSKFREFEQLVKSGDPLKTFFNTFTQEPPASESGLADYIKDFLEHLNGEKEAYIEGKTFTPEQINSGLDKLKEFVQHENLQIDVDQYIDKSLESDDKKPEEVGAAGANPLPGQEQPMGTATPPPAPGEQQLGGVPAMGAPLGASSNTTVKTASDYSLPEGSTVPLGKSVSTMINNAASRTDIKIADSLSFLNRIEALINTVRASNSFNRTAEMDVSMDALLTKISGLKFFIREELVNEPTMEKEAACVILAHIVHDLEKVKKEYENLNNNPTAGFTATSMLTSKLKKAKLLLDTIN